MSYDMSEILEMCGGFPMWGNDGSLVGGGVSHVGRNGGYPMWGGMVDLPRGGWWSVTLLG